MSSEEEYLEMLAAARKEAPTVITSGERFKPPRPLVAVIGRQTHVSNFRELASSLNRDPQLLARFLSRELGSPYFITEESKKLILSRRIEPHLVEARIKKFIERYVLCPVCGRPDTKIIKIKRGWVLKCEACGAESPIPKI